MIFRLLRQIFQDSEFEQTRIELAEARKVLSEYKEIIHYRTKTVEEDKDKPDIEFITLLWASIGLAMIVAGNAAEKLPNDVMAISTIQEGIWLIIALVTTMFVVLNFLFAIDLTKNYANSKSDKRYLMYSQTLSIGILTLIIGLGLVAIFNGLP